MIRLAVILCTVLWLCGWSACRPSYRQAAADAKAGIEAARMEQDAAKRALIMQGVADRVYAMLNSIDDLPAPTATAVEIQADPEAYASAGAKVAADPPKLDTLTDETPEPGVWDKIRARGSWLLDSGLMIGGIGAIVLIIFAVCGWLKYAPTGLIWRFISAAFPPLARFAALWGGASAATGSALVWLADYYGIVIAVAMVCGGVAVWFNWKDLVKMWRAWRARAVKP